MLAAIGQRLARVRGIARMGVPAGHCQDTIEAETKVVGRGQLSFPWTQTGPVLLAGLLFWRCHRNSDIVGPRLWAIRAV